MNKLLATVAAVAMLSATTAAFAQDNTMSAPADSGAGMSKSDTGSTAPAKKSSHKHSGKKHHKKTTSDSTSSDTTK